MEDNFLNFKKKSKSETELYIYGNIGNANDKLTLPLYMSMFL